MAGGMNKRGNYGSMADRVGAAPPPSDQPAPAVKHCWVHGRHGRVPGLLLEWRQHDGAWRGRVVRPVDEGDGWVVVEDWVDAALLDPA
jgi:hypothetical protein